MHVNRHTDQAARHGAFEFVLAGQVCCVRATGTHRHAKALRGAHHNVSVPFAGGRQKCQRQRVSGGDERRLLAVNHRYIGAQIVNTATGGRVLRQYGKVVALQCGVPFRRRVGQQHGDAQRFGAGLNDFNRLRMAVARHHKDV